MLLRPRPEIEKLAPAYHGGLNQAELKAMGLNAEDIINFSVSSNPFMSSPDLREIIDTVTVSRYPDSEATEFRECLAEITGVSPENILAGNGSMEPIRLIASAYFDRGDSILILEPTFGEYRVACQIAGASVTGQWGKEEDNFAHQIDETIDLIKRNRPKGVFICNPNNPTGRYLSRRGVEIVLNACREQETLLVIDEAYISFVEQSWHSFDLIEEGGVIIVRSMTKSYALAGLRLGYAVAHREIIETLRRVQPPWSVNVIAQKAGILALKNTDGLESSRRELSRAKQFLVGEFHRLGYAPVPSDTNFFLVKTGNVKDFRTALLKQGIMVRDCASFGLPEYIRVAARPIPECERLVAAIGGTKMKKGDK